MIPALDIQNLSKRFGGARALDGVSLSVMPGEVHGLLGQNGSGKSTLIKVLAGFHAPEPGARISVGGTPLVLPMESGAFLRLGLSFVHQHLGLVPSLTVLENLLVGDHAARGRWAVPWRREHGRALALFDRFGLSMDPSAPVARLSPVERATLAIVRAHRQLEAAGPDGARAGARVLVLDEPTPFLPARDVEALFRLVRSLAEQGASVVFVSHDIDEVIALTHRATVLRDGRVAGSFATADLGRGDIVRLIVGRNIELVGGRAPPRPFGPVVASVAGLAGEIVAGLDLDLRSGEVVGLTGLIGSGFDEVAQAIYGARRARAGTVTLGGRVRALAGMTPAAALAAGCIYVPADRLAAGGVAGLPVVDNVTLPMVSERRRGWALRRGDLLVRAARLAERYDVRPRDPSRPLGALSGGNQQKVVLAKWFQTGPRLVLLDEPTQGVDVGAREQVFAAIRDMAGRGAAVLCASSDHEQLAALCDRVLVFGRGRVVASLEGPAVSRAAIGARCYEAAKGAET